MKNILSLCLLGIFLQTCSVSVSLTGGSVSPLSKTFSVAEFENFAPIVNPILATRFTEALKLFMEQNSSLDIVEDGGDLHFEGKITGYDTRPVSVARNNNDTPEAEQSRFTLTIFVAFFDEQNPKNNFESSFSHFIDYDANIILEEFLTDDILNQVFRQILEDVYNKAVVNW